MAEGMSRREWWSIVGGFLAAVGLVPKAPAQTPAAKPPPPVAPPPSLAFTYDSAASGDRVTSYVYDCRNRLISICDPPRSNREHS